MTKKELRAEVRRTREALTGDYLREASEEIQKRVSALDEFRRAENLFLYVNLPREPGTGKLLALCQAMGKRVCVPKCLENRQMAAVELRSPDDLAPGAMGISEPKDCSRTVEPEELDLIVVPCVSAWKDGSRLGHGGGYYDIFLERTKAVKLCVCFDRLLRADIPMDDNDIYMDYLITENDCIACKQYR